jgi:RNA-binding protein YlmH
MTLKEALADAKLVMSYGEVRSAVSQGLVKINGTVAKTAEELVQKGDLLTLGKTRQTTVQ